MTSGHEIAMALRAAYRALHRQTDALLAARGATADQFVLMSLLAEEDDLTQQELVRRASSDANTVRAMLVLLEHQGLVSRRPHARDARARSVALTPKGRRIYARLWARSEPFRQQFLSALGQDEAAALVEGLQRITQAMGPPAIRRGRNRRRLAPAAADT